MNCRGILLKLSICSVGRCSKVEQLVKRSSAIGHEFQAALYTANVA